MSQLESNVCDLIDEAALLVPSSVSARLRALMDREEARRPPDGFDDFWGGIREAAPAGPLVRERALGATPAATYEEVRIPLADGGAASARLILPRVPAPVPIVLMFHDAGRPVRGWHHMTRFAALGAGVLALDADSLAAGPPREGALARILAGGTDLAGLSATDIAAAEAVLGRAAVALASAAARLPEVDGASLHVWGEGLGAALALAAAAFAPAAVASVTLANPRPCGELDLPHLDARHLAPRVFQRALVGTGLMDAVAPPEGQFSVVKLLGGPIRHIVFPKYAHERINEFENAHLAFLHTVLQGGRSADGAPSHPSHAR